MWSYYKTKKIIIKLKLNKIKINIITKINNMKV